MMSAVIYPSFIKGKEEEQTCHIDRINRIEGQIGGIKKMIVDEKPFDEVIIQLNSAKAAIQKISQILLEAHADHTFIDAVESGKTEQELESLRRAIHQYSKML